MPASTMIVPAPPAAPAGVTAFLDAAGSVTITVPAPPLTGPSAIGPYRLSVFRHTAGSPIIALGTTELHTTPHVVTDVPPPGTAVADVSYTLIVTDPIGRAGPPATVRPV
jgi:hypothetical protein